MTATSWVFTASFLSCNSKRWPLGSSWKICSSTPLNRTAISCNSCLTRYFLQGERFLSNPCCPVHSPHALTADRLMLRLWYSSGCSGRPSPHGEPLFRLDPSHNHIP